MQEHLGSVKLHMTAPSRTSEPARRQLEGEGTMPRSSTHRRAIANRILSALPPEDYERILPDLKAVPLKFLVSLHEPGDKMPYVYFPDTGVISMLTVLADGDAVEIATVGNEGMTDLSVFLGLEESDSRLLIQVPGTAMRMESARFRVHVEQLRPSERCLGTTACHCLPSSRSQRPAIACTRSSNDARGGYS
jgi:hypothetical protein